ncbi:MAG: hypothetical protein EBR82_56825 [Caulobacteraceae bacterium]|nr:hypothetical protein [Caulobacteraceae bacterium]
MWLEQRQPQHPDERMESHRDYCCAACGADTAYGDCADGCPLAPLSEAAWLALESEADQQDSEDPDDLPPVWEEGRQNLTGLPVQGEAQSVGLNGDVQPLMLGVLL